MLAKTFVLGLLASTAFAHPGEEHDVAAEIKARDLATHHQSRSLAKCFGRRNVRNLQERAIKRRVEKAAALRRTRGLPNSPYYLNRRDFATYAAESHNMSTQGYTLDTSTSTLFGSNYSCILVAEVTEGPYYVSGEYIREDVTEGQEGVPVHLEIQTIDTSTCEPATGLYYDIWHANSTGVYSGVIANGNGDSSDETNLNNTAFRGLQPTDSDGVVAFDTAFPGHYTGRATHIHVAAHHGGSVLANNTYSGGTVSHVGQLFFDQALISAIDTVAPYVSNTQSLTLNTADSIAQGEGDNNYDPFVEYAYLGDSVADGLIMWISIGVDMTASYSPNAAATLTSAGGVANANSGFGGGSGGPGGNGTMPSGNFTGGPPGNMTGGAPPSGSGFPSSSGAPGSGIPDASTPLAGTATSSNALSEATNSSPASSSSLSASPSTSSSAGTGASRSRSKSHSSSRAHHSSSSRAAAGGAGKTSSRHASKSSVSSTFVTVPSSKACSGKTKTVTVTVTK